MSKPARKPNQPPHPIDALKTSQLDQVAESRGVSRRWRSGKAKDADDDAKAVRLRKLAKIARLEREITGEPEW